mmetsp:Transcript_14343/g.49018  ORF Transcript_14343/g.49018 Transcript_14343/m.49018 type:complete len:358 (-) Transcript_14343:1292-2365(-)
MTMLYKSLNRVTSLVDASAAGDGDHRDIGLGVEDRTTMVGEGRPGVGLYPQSLQAVEGGDGASSCISERNADKADVPEPLALAHHGLEADVPETVASVELDLLQLLGEDGVQLSADVHALVELQDAKGRREFSEKFRDEDVAGADIKGFKLIETVKGVQVVSLLLAAPELPLLLVHSPIVIVVVVVALLVAHLEDTLLFLRPLVPLPGREGPRSPFAMIQVNLEPSSKQVPDIGREGSEQPVKAERLALGDVNPLQEQQAHERCRCLIAHVGMLQVERPQHGEAGEIPKVCGDAHEARKLQPLKEREAQRSRLRLLPLVADLFMANIPSHQVQACKGRSLMKDLAEGGRGILALAEV